MSKSKIEWTGSNLQSNRMHESIVMVVQIVMLKKWQID